MRMDVSDVLVAAVLEHVRRNSALKALGLIAIEAHLPNSQDAGSLALSAHSVRSWASATFEGAEHGWEFRLVMPSSSGEAVRRMISILIEMLHGADIPLPDHALVDLQFRSSETVIADDADVSVTRMRFSALTVAD